MKSAEINITERQKETYNFIFEYIKKFGYSPSLREVANGIYASKPVALKHINKLTEYGIITHTNRVARSIVIKKAL